MTLINHTKGLWTWELQWYIIPFRTFEFQGEFQNEKKRTIASKKKEEKYFEKTCNTLFLQTTVFTHNLIALTMLAYCQLFLTWHYRKIFPIKSKRTLLFPNHTHDWSNRRHFLTKYSFDSHITLHYCQWLILMLSDRFCKRSRFRNRHLDKSCVKLALLHFYAR